MTDSSGERAPAYDVDVTDVNRFRDAPADYTELVRGFRLTRPATFNMAGSSVSRHARGPLAGRTALVCDVPGESRSSHTYAELDALSDRAAAFLRSLGVARGDVVVCYASQRLESALVHLGCYKLGAIVAPLSLLYGPDTVRHAVEDSRARIVVAERAAWDRLEAVRPAMTGLDTVVIIGPARSGETAFGQVFDTGIPDGFRCTDTAATDPALLLYTSGSTGLPKGILHCHGFLIGYFASVSLFYELEMGTPGQVLWTPSDWSWIAGVVNTMMTGWYFGQTVVAGQDRFSPDWVFDFMARNGVTHTFLTPTALKRMAEVAEPRRRWPGLALMAIGTGGEPCPSAVLDWGRESLGVPINEFYGLTEVNHLVGNCSRLYPVKPGSMGRAYPGHTLAIIDESGNELPRGTMGEIAARDDDPTLFLGYWRQPERTAAMKTGRWVRTGDFAVLDADGYFWYHGRNDDLIKSAGYRIGPAEVEDTLIRHPAVAEAAVVGKPDADRGQLVKAFVRLAAGAAAGDELTAELQRFVKENLAAYKFPREIEYVTQYPLTSTGKISRKALRLAEIERARAGGVGARVPEGQPPVFS